MAFWPIYLTGGDDMNYASTRDRKQERLYSLPEAMMTALAPDGGLFFPVVIPQINNAPLGQCSSFVEMAFEVLHPYFEDSELESSLPEICMDAFSFPVDLKQISPKTTVLELFHGPTAAFKDFGARFLASAMDRLLELSGQRRTILVATSGDTGSAVASAFHGKKNIDVKVLFPKGRVSERQRIQLTCWDSNVSSYEVDGSFDDCQAMVKQAFMDPGLRGLASANSINLGRLLPQTTYYYFASFSYALQAGRMPTIIVPSGNLGNCTAAFMAQIAGAPIERIVLATNANRSVEDYLEKGSFEPRASIQTLANAMDVGSPSNMERLMYLYPDFKDFKSQIKAFSVSDEEIRATIKAVYDETGYVMCPHTATAECVRRRDLGDREAIVVSTASPAKFNHIVEPIIGRQLMVPSQLESLLKRPCKAIAIKADYHELF